MKYAIEQIEEMDPANFQDAEIVESDADLIGTTEATQVHQHLPVADPITERDKQTLRASLELVRDPEPEL